MSVVYFKIRQTKVWQEYSKGKQTYGQLAQRYHVSKRTIQRWIDDFQPQPLARSASRKIILLMDTTYFGKGFGVMVFRDNSLRENLFWKYVKHETLKDYIDGVEQLRQQGFEIDAIVCDGKRGLLKAFKDIPVQMCQYHQSQIVTRYITRRSKLSAHQELLDVMHLMHHTDKESFYGCLEQWRTKWQSFMDEKTYDEQTERNHYKHRRLRSAYRSIITNLAFLFTWYDHAELKIPPTTNGLEGIFTELKTKVRVHSGIKSHRRIKLIDTILQKTKRGS